MKLYRIRLRPRGPFLTPWHADTLAGSLCWELVRAEGEEALAALLDRCRAGAPPFVLSDAFPGDLLPTPLCAYRLIPGGDRDSFELGRRWKRTHWLAREAFESVRAGRLPELAEAAVTSPFVKTTRLHASLSRQSNTTFEQGGLREEEETYLAEGLDVFTIYALVEDDWATLLDRLCCALARSGFGKKKSSGKGAVDYLGMEPWEGFPSAPGADGFVSLSHFVPAPDDPTDGDYDILVKYGKLGEEHALGENPFKRPLILLKPGSSFRTLGPVRPWYGRAVAGLAPERPEALQLAFALAVPMCLPKE